MKFIKKLQNKKILLILFILFVLIVSVIYLAINNRKDTEIKVEYTEKERQILEGDTENLFNSSEDASFVLDVKYPNFWDLEKQDFSDENIQLQHFQIDSDDDGFEYTVTYERLSDQLIENYDDASIMGDGLRLVTDEYAVDDFEILSITDEASLYISKTGGVYYNKNDLRLEADEVRLGKDYYIYQRYTSTEYGSGLHPLLNIFQKDRRDYPISYRGVTISYKFKTEESILKWDLYKKVLQEVVSSLEESGQ